MKMYPIDVEIVDGEIKLSQEYNDGDSDVILLSVKQFDIIYKEMVVPLINPPCRESK